jgi:hypothetical protein
MGALHEPVFWISTALCGVPMFWYFAVVLGRRR